MAKSKAFEKFINLAYGLGASVVVIGALFKILHYEIWILTGGVMLTIGLGTEAVIFAISAFEPVKDDLDWSRVYPELSGEKPAGYSMSGSDSKQEEETEGMLSKKLDEMLKDAKLDSALMERLGNSIRDFEGAAKKMNPTAEAMESQKRYGEEMSNAASQMESLNNLYKVQLENSDKQHQAKEAVVKNAAELQSQMEELKNNLAELNGVYGGMLTAMQPKGPAQPQPQQ